MTRYVDTSQRSTAGEISSLTKHVEKLAKSQSLVATETSAQTATLANLNELITTLTSAVSKNVLYVFQACSLQALDRRWTDEVASRCPTLGHGL